MFVKKLSILAVALAFSHAAAAEENQNLSSHLQFVPQTETTPAADMAQPVYAPQAALPASTQAASTAALPDSTAAASASAPAATQPTADAAPASDLWSRIRTGFALNEVDEQLVARHERWYASHPIYVAQMTERAQRYLYYITSEVERRGMPAEIALLPMIESAFNPGANSIARASGLWQFIPSTGKKFGMEQNWWYDGRRDIVGATNGALDYLQKLHDQFGDWQLALAAYNWGENAVARAQLRNRQHHKPTDFAHLRLPRETRNYVPKLLAVKHIVEDPARFGLTLAAIPDQPYFAEIKPSRPMDVKVAAQLAEISMDEFRALNPGHNRPVILQDTADVLLLPVDKVAVFQSNLEKYDQRLVSWRAYQTKRGEPFVKVAAHFGLSMAELRNANGLSKFASVSNGQTLLVPASDDPHTDEFTPFNMHAGAVAEMSGVLYKVRKGDTISGIANRFHVSQASLMQMNHGSRRLHIGQTFNILAGSSMPHHVAHKRTIVRQVVAKRRAPSRLTKVAMR